MTTIHKNTSQIMGVNLNAVSATAVFPLGTRVTTDLGGTFEYVQASGAITGAGYSVVIDEEGLAALASTTSTASAFGQRVGIAPVAFADTEYGWVQVDGYCEAIRVSASCAANVKVNSTATGGQLDDDATTGAEVIDGIVLTTARGGTAGTAEGILTWPKVGATL